MHAEPEGDVGAGVAVQVQCVGVGECLLVAVAGLVGEDDAVAGVDELAVDLDVGERDPAPTGVDDGQIAQQFLDRAR